MGMASVIADRIASFRAATFSEAGESHSKCDIVRGLEEHLAAPEALAFILDLIGDQREYDMARLEALKILQLCEPSSDHRVQIGRRLAQAMLVESDILVQQWMAIAAANYIGVPEVFGALITLLNDIGADLDVRYNCLAAVRILGRTAETAKALSPLLSDPEFGPPVRRILNQ
jgi:hypothetical protein